ncbi:unnamed protein product, partial [Cyprideis torosa]
VITAFPETGSHSAFLKLLQNEFDIWKEGVLAETDMFVSPDKLSYLLGLLKAVQIPHKVQEVDIKSLIEKEKDYLSRRGETFDFKGFYKYHEILEFLTDLARHTEGMDVIEMQGTTYEGRPIKGVRINPEIAAEFEATATTDFATAELSVWDLAALKTRTPDTDTTSCAVLKSCTQAGLSSSPVAEDRGADADQSVRFEPRASVARPTSDFLPLRSQHRRESRIED